MAEDAKKFVKVNGLHNLVVEKPDHTLDITKIKDSIKIANKNTICFVVCDDVDKTYGYSDKYILTQGMVFPTKETSGGTIDIKELSAATQSFSAATVQEIVRLDDTILLLSAGTIYEVNRLDGKIDDLSASTVNEIARLDEVIELFSGSTVNEIERLDTKIDELSASTEEEIIELYETILELSGNTTHGLEVLDEKVDELSANTATEVERLDEKIEELSASTESKVYELSAATINEVERLDEKIDTLSAGTEQELVEVYETIVELSGNTVTEVERLDEKIDELSANTTTEVERLDDKIDELSGNTTHGLEVLDEKIDELSASTESKVYELSAGTIYEVNRLDDKIDELSANTITEIKTLSGNTCDLIKELSAGTENELVEVYETILELSAGTISEINTLSGNTTHGLESLDTEITNLSAGTIELSASTVGSINELSGNTVEYVNTLSSATINIEDVKSNLIFDGMGITFVGDYTLTSDGILTKNEVSSGYNNLLALSLTGNKIITNQRVKTLVSSDVQEFITECIITSATTSDGFVRITKYGTSSDLQIIIQPTNGGTRIYNNTTGLTITTGDIINIELVFEKPNITVNVKNITKNTFYTSTNTTGIGTGTVLKNISSYINGVGTYGILSHDLKYFSVSSNGTNVLGGYLTNTNKIDSNINTLSANTDASIIALSGNTVSYVNTLSGNTKSAINTLSANTVSYVNTLSGNTTNTIKALSGSTVTYVNTLSGNTKTTIDTLSGNTKSTIETLSGNTVAYVNTLSAATVSFSANTVEEIAHIKSELPALIETTYKNIVGLIEESQLKPGVSYRITDYVTKCKSTASNYKSAEHQFDLVVTALSTNKLSEIASAMPHSGDTYFDGCNLSAWDIKYCFDNDTNRFEWAQKYSFNSFYVSAEDLWFDYDSTIIIDDVTYYLWYNDSFEPEEGTSGYLATTVREPEVGEYLAYCVDVDNLIIYEEYSYTINNKSETEGTKGVIYYMKDEFNNECPYDFKNIMFKRYHGDGISLIRSDENTDYYLTENINNIISGSTTAQVYYYTFTWFDRVGKTLSDFSLRGKRGTQNGSTYLSVFYYCDNNSIMPYFVDKKQTLNNNVVISHSTSECKDLYLDTNCYNNSLMNIRQSSFSCLCYGNVIGCDIIKSVTCWDIVMSNRCENNKIITYTATCTDISLGTRCCNNSFDYVVGFTCGNNMEDCSFTTNVGVGVGSYVQNIVVNGGISYLTIESGCKNLELVQSSGGTSQFTKINVYIDSGLGNFTDESRKILNVDLAASGDSESVTINDAPSTRYLKDNSRTVLIP